MKRLAPLLFALLPAPALAHPHIYIDAGFDIYVDGQSHLDAIRITWVYDEYYSLLIAEDLEIDQDFDGELTEAEIQKLTGFDMQWIEGFNGDLVAKLNGEELMLSGPTQPTATMKDGKIITTHLRKVEGSPAIGGKALSLKPFDKTYYSAYQVTMPVKLDGMSACMIEMVTPDIDGALAQMQQQLLRIDADADLEENDYPLVGEEFATDVLVSCPAS